MVLAQTKYLNILHNYQFIMIFMEDGTIYNISHVLLIPSGEKQHGLCVSFWSAEEAFSRRVFADTLEDGTNSTRQLVQSDLRLLGCLLQTLAGSQTCGTHQ
jgi:hypothetical protein